MRLLRSRCTIDAVLPLLHKAVTNVLAVTFTQGVFIGENIVVEVDIELILSTGRKAIESGVHVNAVDRVFERSLEAIFESLDCVELANLRGHDLGRGLFHSRRVGEIAVSKAGIELNAAQDRLQALVVTCVPKRWGELLEEVVRVIRHLNEEPITEQGICLTARQRARDRLGSADDLTLGALKFIEETRPLFIGVANQVLSRAAINGDTQAGRGIDVIADRRRKVAEERLFYILI